MINNLFDKIQTKISLFFFISLMASFAHAGNGAISGTVKDSNGVTPINDITVTAMIWDEPSQFLQTVKWGVTGTDGTYTITDLPEGTYYIMFSDYKFYEYIEEGYIDEVPFDFGARNSKIPVTVTAGGTTSNIDAQLKPGGRITGKVLDSISLVPIANIFVSAWTWDGTEFHYAYGFDTDINGDYILGGLPVDDDYYINFSSDYSNQLYPEQGYGVPTNEEPFDFDSVVNKTAVRVEVDFVSFADTSLTKRDTACYSDTVFVSDVQYTADFTLQSEQNIIADGTVIVDGGDNVNVGAKVSYQAAAITLYPGFHAQAGSDFSATAMSVNPCVNTAARSVSSSLTQSLASTIDVAAVRSIRSSSIQALPTTIQTRTPEDLISKWLSTADIPQALQQLLADKSASANELQSDAAGEIIVFSTATALVDNDTNTVSDIYIYHSLSESLSLISHTIDNISGNGSSTQPRINGSGGYIMYRSEADNLNSISAENYLDDNKVADIYLYDIAAEQTIRVSREEDGSQIQNNASNPSIAGDAPYMVYNKSDNLQQQHVYGVDFTTDIISAIKYSMDDNNFEELIDNIQPAISADGRYVAYLGQTRDTRDEDKTCSQHILDRETGISLESSCPDEIADNPEQWFPLFDSQAENIYWQQIK